MIPVEALREQGYGHGVLGFQLIVPGIRYLVSSVECRVWGTNFIVLCSPRSSHLKSGALLGLVTWRHTPGLDTTHSIEFSVWTMVLRPRSYALIRTLDPARSDRRTIHPAPCILTLSPGSWTLHLAPYPKDQTPRTLHPNLKPWTLDPTPCTVPQRPYTPHPAS
jgi:hypothetical protein